MTISNISLFDVYLNTLPYSFCVFVDCVCGLCVCDCKYMCVCACVHAYEREREGTEVIFVLLFG